MTYGKHERDVSRAKWKQRFARYMPGVDDGWIEEIVETEAKADTYAQVLTRLAIAADAALDTLVGDQPPPAGAEEDVAELRAALAAIDEAKRKLN